jgi:hypothetical protein
VSPPDASAEPAGGERIDAAHPRPDRPTPDRTGEGHGDADAAPDGRLTGDDVSATDERGTALAGGDAERSDEDLEEDPERYRDSPGAGLLRDDDTVPEPNEPG